MLCLSRYQTSSINILYGFLEISGQFGLCPYAFFCNIIKVKYFLCLFIILSHLTSSLLHTWFLFIPYVYFSTESIGCILFSTFEFKASL